MKNFFSKRNKMKTEIWTFRQMAKWKFQPHTKPVCLKILSHKNNSVFTETDQNLKEVLTYSQKLKCCRCGQKRTRHVCNLFQKLSNRKWDFLEEVKRGLVSHKNVRKPLVEKKLNIGWKWCWMKNWTLNVEWRRVEWTILKKHFWKNWNEWETFALLFYKLLWCISGDHFRVGWRVGGLSPCFKTCVPQVESGDFSTSFFDSRTVFFFSE